MATNTITPLHPLFVGSCICGVSKGPLLYMLTSYTDAFVVKGRLHGQSGTEVPMEDQHECSMFCTGFPTPRELLRPGTFLLLFVPVMSATVLELHPQNSLLNG